MIIEFEPKQNPYGLSADEYADARMLAEQLVNTPQDFRMDIAVMAVKIDRKEFVS